MFSIGTYIATSGRLDGSFWCSFGRYFVWSRIRSRPVTIFYPWIQKTENYRAKSCLIRKHLWLKLLEIMLNKLFLNFLRIFILFIYIRNWNIRFWLVKFLLAYIIYSVTSSDPEENVWRMGAHFYRRADERSGGRAQYGGVQWSEQ